MMWTALTAALLSAAAMPSTQCPAANSFPLDVKILNVVRVLKGDDGETHFAPATLTATSREYLNTGKQFSQLNFGEASKVQLVQGPANVSFPLHASLGYEAFLTLAGSSFVTLPDGSERELKPGTLVIMEDMGSKHGHAGRVGPCGYVALQIVPTKPLL